MYDVYVMIRRFPQTIQCMCQSSYIALGCKISLLFRQRTTKDCVDDVRLCCSRMTTIWPSFRKICHTSAVSEGKEIVASSFTVEKKILLISHSGVIFAEDLLKINLLWLRLYVWGTVPCDCLRSGQKVF